MKNQGTKFSSLELACSFWILRLSRVNALSFAVVAMSDQRGLHGGRLWICPASVKG